MPLRSFSCPPLTFSVVVPWPASLLSFPPAISQPGSIFLFLLSVPEQYLQSCLPLSFHWCEWEGWHGSAGSAGQFPFPRARRYDISPQAARPREFRHKCTRRPKEKLMTIAAGFPCSDGLVRCADTQETITGYAKVNTEKITQIKTSLNNLVFTGAGDSGLIDMTVQLIEEAVLLRKPNSVSAVEQVLRESLLEVFNQHLAPWSQYQGQQSPRHHSRCSLARIANVARTARQRTARCFDLPHRERHATAPRELVAP